MLDLMRRHAKSWMVNVIIGAIVLVFVFWGAGSIRKRRPQYVATVNDEAIGFAEYQETYRNLYEQARRRYRQVWSDDLVKALNLKRQALESLINERLLLQAARALKIDVSNKELQDSILSSPAFRLDGVFNVNKYRAILARNKLTPEKFEAIKRRDLIIQKLNRRIMSFAKVLPDEVREDFHFTRDQVEVEFVLFKPEDFVGRVKYTPEELKAFFEKNKARYRVPAKVKVAYLAIRSKDVEDQVKIEPSEVADYYEFNLNKYRQPEKVKARHILFKVKKDATPEEIAKVKARAEFVLKQARAGKDFAALARKYSQGPTAKEGGELGWFERGQMIKPFSDAAFSLKKGEISGLVRTDFGFHIIKVEDRREAGIRPLKEVKGEILKKLTASRAEELASDIAVEMYEKASLAQDLDAVAKEYKLTPVVTDFFSKTEPVGDLGVQKKFADVAFSLKEGEVGPLVDLPSGHYLIKMLKRKKSYIPDLDQVKVSVESDLKEERATELAGAEAKRFLDALHKGGTWSREVKIFKLKPESTSPFTRPDFIPKIGRNEAIISAAFSLIKPGQIAPKPYKTAKGFYVIRLKKIIPASEDTFEKEKATLTQKLQIAKSQDYLRQWIEALRAKASITTHEEMLK